MQKGYTRASRRLEVITMGDKSPRDKEKKKKKAEKKTAPIAVASPIAAAVKPKKS